MGARLGEVVGGIGLTNVAPVTPYESFVDNTVTAPDQNLFIKIPSIDQGRTKKGPCRWIPIPGRDGLIYPTKGDVALSVRSQEGFYWVTNFIPAVYPADLLIPSRVTTLESRSRLITLTSGVSSISLGTFDGDNITGVRIFGAVRTASAGTGNPKFTLKINALSTISQTSITQRLVRSAAATTTDLITFQGDPAAGPGIVVASCDWATSANDVTFNGILSTKSGKLRHYQGTYINQDLISNSANNLSGRLYSIYHDGVPTISSLTLELGVGTFTGRVSVEILP